MSHNVMFDLKMAIAITAKMAILAIMAMAIFNTNMTLIGIH